MGCDIHFYTERRSKRVLREEAINKIIDEQEIVTDDWEYFRTTEPGRNYYLFGALADVRSTFKCGPIAEPRGLPDNISDIVKENYKHWIGDAHSSSYFTLQELIDVDWVKYNDEVTEKNKNTNVFTEFLLIIEEMKKIDSNYSNVRCVFWFDN